MSSKVKVDVQWDDQDSEFDALMSEKTQKSGDDFSKMLAEDHQSEDEFESVQVGDQVTGLITHINETADEAVIDLGAKQVGVMARAELVDPESGEQKGQVGEAITAYVVSRKGGEVFLSKALSNKVAKKEALQDALVAKTPVRGKITGVNKGGFEVQVLGQKGFCPVSQLEMQFVKDPQIHVGKEYDFLVTQIKGRECVVSRRALLERQGLELIKDLKQRIAEKPVLSGSVIEIKDFGLLVDIGGVSGLVHISEAGWSRTEDLQQSYKVGDSVQVKLLSIEDQPGRALPRIGLSIKQVSLDPWDEMGMQFKEGESYSGKVVRLESFGAFVELTPGVDGLIHISQLSWEKRIYHPKDVVKIGDVVSVRILDINSHDKRISLTMKAIEDDPWFEIEKNYPPMSQHEGVVSALKTHGALIDLKPGLSGRLPIETLKKAFGDAYKKKACPPNTLKIVIQSIDLDEKKILLSLPQLQGDDDLEVPDLEQFNKKSQTRRKATGALAEAFQASFGKK